ncbi:structural maintenance of chromosomes protein 2-like [Bolinopsis microptera]|uniref:structural maintenance of chromosomes protein 2-like n=1 Tax=Bolinopsis microptera TaxID=2820187 RepID=UPI0030795DA1
MAIKTLNIAKEKKGDLHEVLQYDLTRYSPLFDGLLMEKPRKHEMCGEVESRAKLTEDDYNYLPGENNAVVIDFMSYIRGQSLDKAVQEPSAPLCFNLTWKHVSWTFGSMIAEAFARILKNNPTAELIHIIFDSYLDLSLKSGERRIRLAEAKGVIRVAMINENTKSTRTTQTVSPEGPREQQKDVSYTYNVFEPGGTILQDSTEGPLGDGGGLPKRVKAEKITDTGFADDIALIADTVKEAEMLMLEVERVAATVGLKMNEGKTKFISQNIENPDTIKSLGNNSIEHVEDFAYLGSRIRDSESDIRPDNQYAMALEVAAGGRLYNVVTDNEDTSALLIKHGQLRRRYVMIPLNKIRSNVIDREVVNSAKRLVGGDNCHLALDVIQFDKQVEPAMKFCFGGVLICKTKEQAKKVAFDKSVKRKVITLEGDVYDPAGTLTGGSRNTSRCVLKELSACKQSRSDLTQYKEQYRQVEGELSKMERVVHEWEELTGQLRLKKHERDLLEERLKQTSHYKDIEELRRTKEELAKQKEIVDNFNDKEKSLLKKCAEVEAKMKNFKSEQEKELKKSEKRILDAKSKLSKCSKEAKAKVNKLKELELEVSSELAKELEGLREQLPKCEEAIAAAQELVEGAQLKLTECAAVREALAAELGAQRELIQQCSAEIENFVKEQKAAEKLISSCGIKLKELTHKLSKLNKEASEAKQQVQYYLNNYEWIASEKQYFGQRDTAYDFEKQDLKESDKKLERLKASKEKLSKNVNMRAMHLLVDVTMVTNMRAMHLLGEAEKRYIDLVKRKDIVTNDKHKINKVIKELDEKKNRAVRRAWEQVNKDFGSIFSTLLPGARVKLQTLEGRPVTDGLEVKVGFGEVWKESLTELSGGQRSLVALSLILSLLLFKPAPLYILDEVDAALDLSHTQNIGQMLRAHFKHSQFVVVSLKDGMFQNANVLFRTKFVDGVSAVTRHTQHSSTKPAPSEKENIQPLVKKNKKQKV